MRRILPAAPSLYAVFLAFSALLLSVVLSACGRSGGHPDFAVKVSGHGRPVIFIPGIAVPGEVWQPTVDALAGICQCHVLTLAGFGDLKPTRTDPFLPNVRDEIIAYIREQKLDHPVIVGHSMGGVMALWVAETAPELPGRLVIVDALPDMAALRYPDVPMKIVRQKIAADVAQIQNCTLVEQTARQQKMLQSWVTSPEVGAKLLTETARSDPWTVGQALGEMMNANLFPGLTKITCPTLVMISIADKIVHATAEQVTRSFQQQYQPLAGVRFKVFDSAHHFIMLDAPQEFQAALIGELAGESK